CVPEGNSIVPERLLASSLITLCHCVVSQLKVAVLLGGMITVIFTCRPCRFHEDRIVPLGLSNDASNQSNPFTKFGVMITCLKPGRLSSGLIPPSPLKNHAPISPNIM